MCGFFFVHRKGISTVTVSTINSVAEFVTNGVTKSFPFYFKFLERKDLVVTYISPEGTSSDLVMGTHYTVAGAGNENGGSVLTVSALAGPGQLIVSRDMEAYQQTSLRNQGKFLAETHEDVFDKLTMLIQQGFSTFKRALTRPFGRDYYDAENRQIKNLKDPVGEQDAVTKSWASSFFEGFTGAVNTTTGILYDSGTLFDYLRFGVGRTVDSIADLRLLKGTRNQRAFVLGYYEKGDGGGGAYYVDLLDTTTADNGGTVIIANDGARWKLEPSDFLNVKQFGARGDSITDDTGCIQAAFDAVHTTSTGMWRKILFPLGGYFVSQTLMAKPNTHISGVGSRIGCAIIRQGNYGHTITCGNDSTGAQGFQCEDLDFIHGDPFSGTEPTMSEISWYSHLFLRGSNTASVRRCYFSRMRHGIYVSGGYWVHITDCLFYGVYDPAVPAFQEGFSNIIFDYDELYGHPVECWVKDSNLAGAKKLNVVGFQIPTADGTYLTQAGDFFEYGIASNHGIDVRAVESLYILGSYFGERAGAGVNLSGRAIGPNPFNPLNVRISDCMFDPCRGGQVTFAPVLNDCFALNTIISNNTAVAGAECNTVIELKLEHHAA